MKKQYLPGPYTCLRSRDGCDETFDIYAPGKDRPLVSIGFWEQEEEAEATARLFTAAPKLLDALNYLLEQTVDMDLKHGIGLSEGEQDAREKALAVLAEVAGEIDPEPVTQRWCGSIGVTITDSDGYGPAGVSNLLQDMCALLAEDWPDVQAVIVEPNSIRLLDAHKTTSA